MSLVRKILLTHSRLLQLSDYEGDEFAWCSLTDRICDFYDFIRSLKLLQKFKIQLNLNFVQTLDIIYERVHCYLTAFRGLSSNITVELCHLVLNFPNLTASFTSGIPGFDVLKQPATLATVYYNPGCEEKKIKHDAEIDHRGIVENAVMAAWESQHETPLIEVARKAASIGANV